MSRAYVAGNHSCWFSKIPEYRDKAVNEVLKLDPDYIVWCYENLKHLKFSDGLIKRIKKSKNEHLGINSQWK